MLFVVEDKPKNDLFIHVGLVIAEGICLPAMFLELLRARSGNTLSWAYVFEWPIFALYALYMWKKLLSDVRNGDQGSPSGDATLEDPGLEQYNAYLREVHRSHHHDTSAQF